MPLQSMETAPKDQDILVYCLYKPMTGSCAFQGFTVTGWSEEEEKWMALNYDDEGEHDVHCSFRMDGTSTESPQLSH